MTTVNGLLSREEALAYWDARHLRQSALRSGGDVGLDDASNEAFYAVRLGRLLELITGAVEPSRAQYLLDAGCGKGWFSRALTRCGYDVAGIDTSENAIEFARLAGGGPHYEVATLSSWSGDLFFDVVASIDVLFHILDDDEWEASLLNLACFTRLGGWLIVSDEDGDERSRLGNYIVHRTRHEYCAALGDRAFRHVGFLPYRFRHNRVGLHAFTRVA
jgi:2-polyprenyl-3-methyl-5-hydroxy-6-metoxy-1,4-benzoquinol methylase